MPSAFPAAIPPSPLNATATSMVPRASSVSISSPRKPPKSPPSIPMPAASPSLPPAPKSLTISTRKSSKFATSPLPTKSRASALAWAFSSGPPTNPASTSSAPSKENPPTSPSFPSRPSFLTPRANPLPSPRRACFSTASPSANSVSPTTAASSPSSSPASATSKSSLSNLSSSPSYLCALCVLCGEQSLSLLGRLRSLCGPSTNSVIRFSLPSLLCELCVLCDLCAILGLLFSFLPLCSLCSSLCDGRLPRPGRGVTVPLSFLWESVAQSLLTVHLGLLCLAEVLCHPDRSNGALCRCAAEGSWHNLFPATHPSCFSLLCALCVLPSVTGARPDPVGVLPSLFSANLFLPSASAFFSPLSLLKTEN